MLVARWKPGEGACLWYACRSSVVLRVMYMQARSLQGTVAAGALARMWQQAKAAHITWTPDMRLKL